MPESYLFASRVIVFVSALLYWGGVYVQARRIRRRIGRAPNVRPRGAKERLLWAGWAFVVAAWFGLPFVSCATASTVLTRILPALSGWMGFFTGITLVVAGYVGTLWCYAAMGTSWRMGVNRAEKTTLVQTGPYRFIRHPIYLFQALMLAGATALLPTPAWFLVLAVHIACVLVKAGDEEAYLHSLPGQEYGDYASRTGRFFPRIFKPET